jgi:RNA polymerase sigma factor (sigma-70 family)
MKDDSQVLRWLLDVKPEIERSASVIIGGDGQDIVQDVSVMAVLRESEFESYDEFRRWCFKRAHWLALDELARQSWFARDSEKEIEKLEVTDKEPDRLALYRAIELLPRKQKIVVRERIAGYLTAEIAERNGIEKSTVRSLWRHAKQNLVSQFEREAK